MDRGDLDVQQRGVFQPVEQRRAGQQHQNHSRQAAEVGEHLHPVDADKGHHDPGHRADDHAPDNLQQRVAIQVRIGGDALAAQVGDHVGTGVGGGDERDKRDKQQKRDHQAAGRQLLEHLVQHMLHALLVEHAVQAAIAEGIEIQAAAGEDANPQRGEQRRVQHVDLDKFAHPVAPADLAEEQRTHRRPGEPYRPVEHRPALRPAVATGGAGGQAAAEEGVEVDPQGLDAQAEDVQGWSAQPYKRAQGQHDPGVERRQHDDAALQATGGRGDKGEHDHRDDQGQAQGRGLAANVLAQAAGQGQCAGAQGRRHARHQGEHRQGVDQPGIPLDPLGAEQGLQHGANREVAAQVVEHQGKDQGGHQVNRVGREGPVQEHRRQGKALGRRAARLDRQAGGWRVQVVERLGRGPEQHAHRQGGTQRDHEPAPFAQQRRSTLPADTHVAQGRKIHNGREHHHGERAGTEQPGEVLQDHGVELFAHGKECGEVDVARDYRRQQNQKSWPEDQRTQWVFHLVRFPRQTIFIAFAGHC